MHTAVVYSEGGTDMTNQQKEKIREMREHGLSYANISSELGISENTIKSYCRRNGISGVVTKATVLPDVSYCRQCKKPLTRTAGAKKKLFCSDKCRMAWWNAHPEAVNRKATYTFVCQACGKEFKSYGNKQRKYCSRSCYGKSKVVRHE